MRLGVLTLKFRQSLTSVYVLAKQARMKISVNTISYERQVWSRTTFASIIEVLEKNFLPLCFLFGVSLSVLTLVNILARRPTSCFVDFVKYGLSFPVG